MTVAAGLTVAQEQQTEKQAVEQEVQVLKVAYIRRRNSKAHGLDEQVRSLQALCLRMSKEGKWREENDRVRWLLLGRIRYKKSQDLVLTP